MITNMINKASYLRLISTDKNNKADSYLQYKQWFFVISIWENSREWLILSQREFFPWKFSITIKEANERKAICEWIHLNVSLDFLNRTEENEKFSLHSQYSTPLNNTFIHSNSYAV